MGISWPRSNSFEFDDNGDRAPGAKIYFFEAGTSTPKPSYTTAELNTTHTNPVLADGNGRWPAIFLDFGSYKEMATTSGGTQLWETDDIPNPAPTDPGEGVAATSIFQTGQIIFAGANASFTGFVRCNGRTIGSASSSATERANADTADLFAYLWNNYANGQAAVSGGRGATAAADFAANKAIALPNYRSCALTGFDDMGSTALGGYNDAPVVTGSGILAGSILGNATHTLSAAEIPAHTHSFSATSSSDGSHSHTGTTQNQNQNHTHTGTTGTESSGHTHSIPSGGYSGVKANEADTGTAGAGYMNTGSQTTGTASATHTHSFTTAIESGGHDHTFSTSTQAAHTHTISGTSGSYGAGAAHNIMARSAPVTVLMKL